MLVWLALLLFVLVWASWLFGQIFTGKRKVFVFIAMLLVSSLGTLGIYYFEGAHKELEQTAAMHQQLKDLTLRELADKADQREITMEQLLSELRLRNELEPNNFEKWRELGTIFLRFGEIARAEQAFTRAVSAKPGAETRLEFAQTFMELGTEEGLEYAERHIKLVLINNPKHEGALLLQGINNFKQKDYQSAVYYWSNLLKQREPGSESYKIIKEQIELAERKLKMEALNHIKVIVDNLDELILTRYKKAFVLVRREQGGPPVAVKSIDISKLDEPLKLSPDNVMLPGVDLWASENVYVEVRLSQSGLAQPEAGDKFGKTEILSTLTPSETFHIEITERVE